MKRLSRSMNQDAIIVGLNALDLSLIGVSLLVGIQFSQMMGLEGGLSSFIVPILFVSVLVPTRLRFRRKILRDTLKFYFSRRAVRVYPYR
jgi:uncharacterized membrane protein YkgB